MKIVANRAACAGHARCWAVAKEVFDLDEDGYILFDTKDVPAGLEVLARRGVRACPERILSLLQDA